MNNFPGYRIIDKIHEFKKTVIYRGIRNQDKRSVFVKTFINEYPSVKDIEKLQNEFEITRSLDIDGVIKPIAIENHNSNTALILENFDGKFLKDLIGSVGIDVPLFLRIAILLSETLFDIHRNNIIHCNITPDNIIISIESLLNKSEELKAKIACFGCSPLRLHGEQQVADLDFVDIPMEYISPEQSRRLGRSVDYRADLYSLGITFYEMLTGDVPFRSDDALELIHSHIAKEPVKPNSVKTGIPEIISDIIIKLLSKDADDRYQSAYGLKYDLEECLNQLAGFGKIESFNLGEHDITGKLQFPLKLYGREKEIGVLMECFKRAGSGISELMLVSGYAGIGKTVLINEIQRPVIRGGGYFITGKFEQFIRDMPYNGIIQAFRALIKQLLTGKEEEVERWRDIILNALMPNAQLIIDVIPELELITGKQPLVPDVGPEKLQNRFNMYFLKFVKAFIQDGTPLVLFLDDLQWADITSLNMIKILITDPDIRHILIIGAFRDNEVSASHSLMITLEEIRRDRKNIYNITLSPIEKSAVNHFIADTLRCTRSKSNSLSELIYRKTGGNPFYVKEFLKNINDERYLYFERDGWQWDIDELNGMPVTDNVIDLLKIRINRMPPRLQGVITMASCIGNRFSLSLLSGVYKMPEDEILEDLLELQHEGLIIHVGDSLYRFIHDRIQEAAYSLIPYSERMNIHYQIGIILLSMPEVEELDGNLFIIVDQLNHAHELTDDAGRVRLAELNLTAGRKAKSSAAYQPALVYLRMGKDLLETSKDESVWRKHNELAFNLYKELAEAEYLNGNFAVSEELINLAIHHVESVVEKAELYNLLIIQYTMTGRHDESINTGKEVLQVLGVELPDIDLERVVDDGISRIKKYRENLDVDSLLQLPEKDAPDKRIAIKILRNLKAPTYLFSRELYVIIVMKLVDLSLDCGLLPEISSGFSGFGVILGTVFGDYKTGYEFGKLSQILSKKSYLIAQKCEDNHNYANFILPWIRHLSEAEEINSEGLKAGLEAGELRYTGYIFAHKLFHKLYMGKNLNHILSEIFVGLSFNRKTKNQLAIDMFIGFSNLLKYYTGKIKGDSSYTFINDEFNEEHYVENCINNVSHTGLCQYYILKSQFLYIHERYKEAFNSISEATDLLKFSIGGIHLADFNFYYSLIITALYEDVSGEEQKQHIEQLENNQKQMKLWADNCRENFLHKYLIVEAEIARITGKEIEAMDLYDNAIEVAQENEYIQDEAITNELAARFWLGKKKIEFAKLYLERAYQGYQFWGAKSKIAGLEKKYKELLGQQGFLVMPGEEKIPDTASISTKLDHESILRSFQTLSSEIQLDKLLTKMNKIILQNSGAQKFFLIIEKDGKLFIESEGSINNEDAEILQSVPVGEGAIILPESIINYVARTGEDIVLNNAIEEGMFTEDPYIKKNRSKSILCIKRQSGKTTAISYLENDITTGTFTHEMIELLRVLSIQSTISIENARLYNEQNVTLKKMRGLDKLKDKLLSQYEESRHKNLQERMNPQFLLNAISAIHTLLHKDLGKADEAIVRLGEIYHFLMEQSFLSSIPFVKEWQFVKNYLDFEKLRFPDILSFQVSSSGDFNDILIPPLTLQPIVANSIEHGLRGKGDTGFVRVVAERSRNDVRIEILDDGIGLKTENLFSQTLGNIRDRLKYHYEDSDLEVHDLEEGGVKAVIYFRTNTGFKK